MLNLATFRHHTSSFHEDESYQGLGEYHTQYVAVNGDVLNVWERTGPGEPYTHAELNGKPVDNALVEEIKNFFN